MRSIRYVMPPSFTAPGLNTDVASVSKGGISGMSALVRIGFPGCRRMVPPLPRSCGPPHLDGHAADGPRRARGDRSFDRAAVDADRRDAALDAVGVLHLNDVPGPAEDPLGPERFPRRRDDRIDDQPAVSRPQAQDMVVPDAVHPGGRACLPGVAGLAGGLVLVARDVLGIDIGLGAKGLLSDPPRKHLLEIGEGPLPPAQQALGLDDPGRRVAEDRAVLFFARDTAGD